MPAPPDAADVRRPGPWQVARRLFAAFRSHSFATDGAWVVATQIVGKGTATLLSLALARTLAVRDFSAFTYLFATATLLSSYLAAGLPLVLSRITAEGRDGRSWGDDDRFGAALLVTAVVSAAAVIAAPIYVGWLLSDEVPVSGALIVAAGVAITWAALAQAALYGSGAFRAAFSPVVAGTVLVLATAGAAVLLHSMTVLVVGNIASILTPAIAYTRQLHRMGVLSRRHWTRLPGRAAMAEVLATTVPGLGFSVIYASMNWLLVRTLVEQQSTPDQLNQYAIGLQWFSLVLFIPLAFGQVLFPKFVQKSRSRSLTVTQIVTPAALTFATVLACAVMGALLAPLVTSVYGGRYAFSAIFVFTVLLAAALSGAVNLLGSFVMAARGLATWFYINLASAGMAGLMLWTLRVDTALAAARILCLIQLTPVTLACILVVRHRSRHPLSHDSREEVVSLPPATPLSDH